MSPLSLITSAIFLTILGYFFWKWRLQSENFLRTYSLHAGSTLLSAFLFLIAIASLILGNLDIIDLTGNTKNLTQWWDIIFGVDVSKSMDAHDIASGSQKMSRLDFAKKFMLDFIWDHPENRYGITLFAGKSVIASPLTTDQAVIADIISSIDSKSIREWGTNLEDALSLAIGRFATDTEKTSSKTLVLLTDGGEPDDVDSWQNIQDIISSRKDLESLIVGIGTKEGSIIPLGNDAFGNPIIKTQDGRPVMTTIGKENLERLSSLLSTSVRYVTSSGDAAGLMKDLENVTRQKNHLWNPSDSHVSQSIFLFIAGISLLASMLIIRIKK